MRECRFASAATRLNPGLRCYRYAELQGGETRHAADHAAHGLPVLQVATLATRYAEVPEQELPLGPEEVERLRAFSPRFEQLCRQLALAGVEPTVQHDDPHMASVYERDGRLRVLDWGDTSISHPFFSLVATFRFLEEQTGLRPDHPWFARLRDCYLESWGRGLGEVFDLALRVGRFAHAIAWARLRAFLDPSERATFDGWFAHVLRHALEVT